MERRERRGNGCNGGNGGNGGNGRNGRNGRNGTESSSPSLLPSALARSSYTKRRLSAERTTAARGGRTRVTPSATCKGRGSPRRDCGTGVAAGCKGRGTTPQLAAKGVGWFAAGLLRPFRPVISATARLPPRRSMRLSRAPGGNGSSAASCSRRPRSTTLVSSICPAAASSCAAAACSVIG